MKQQDFTAEECIWTPKKEAEYRAQKAENAELRAEVELLRNHNTLLKKALYGSKSEKTEAVMDDGEQLNLFNEAEAERDDRRREKEEPVAVAAHTRKKKRTMRKWARDFGWKKSFIRYRKKKDFVRSAAPK